jgi:uncharacterized protein YdaU (DUF1376 family)
MHFYKFHIGDYMSHTRHLSLLEDLAYRRLLDFYFLHEQPIKHRDAARQIGMREHEEDVLTVLNEFFLSTDNGFVNPRANKEIEEYKAHQGTSAYGAFIRDNQSLKSVVQKDVYIQHFSSGTLDTYIKTLRTQDVPIMSTSSIHDATTNHKPLTINHKPIKEKQQRGSRLAQDWFLSKSMGDWATQERPDVDVRQVAEQFKDYWVAQAGQKGVKLDWDATWRNWIRNTKAVKPNPYDVGRLTVAPSNEPDPALLKIEEDAKKAAPIPLAVLAKMAELRKKA